MSDAPSEGRGKPVTATVTQRIEPACEAAYEALLDGIHEEVHAFGGFLRREVIKSTGGPLLDYTFILHFADKHSLQRWQHSPERAKWTSRMASLAAETSPFQVLTGIETWFTLSPGQAMVPPPRYKMAVVTWLAIFPLIILISYAMTALFGDLHILLRAFIASAALVPIMTYIVMPRLTRLFRGWLYTEQSQTG